MNSFVPSVMFWWFLRGPTLLVSCFYSSKDRGYELFSFHQLQSNFHEHLSHYLSKFVETHDFQHIISIFPFHFYDPTIAYYSLCSQHPLHSSLSAFPSKNYTTPISPSSPPLPSRSHPCICSSWIQSYPRSESLGLVQSSSSYSTTSTSYSPLSSSTCASAPCPPLLWIC